MPGAVADGILAAALQGRRRARRHKQPARERFRTSDSLPTLMERARSRTDGTRTTLLGGSARGACASTECPMEGIGVAGGALCVGDRLWVAPPVGLGLRPFGRFPEVVDGLICLMPSETSVPI